jgi:glucose-6-phosphate-specific signal transduction histidine kinase
MQPGSRNRHGSFGLVGIEERVGILGGSFSISSGLDSGTTVVVTIPVVGMCGEMGMDFYPGRTSPVAVAA